MGMLFFSVIAIEPSWPEKRWGLSQADNLFQANDLPEHLPAFFFGKVRLLQLLVQGEKDHFRAVFVAGVLVREMAGIIIHGVHG
jgi:hypothetical protein